ncbi:MAG TPA: FliA/WhiG family RNA polymerase sigma factor [Bryobacteraceae bacterium]|nr:FliA/WhiG family RNA polymerase sigma factor [Bryobacteraceae bacterium]
MQAIETTSANTENIAALSSKEREELILEHLPQVRLIARRIHERMPGNVSLEDLISAGIIGLIGAIDRFDASLGVKLKTYAEFKIRGSILDSLRSVDWAPREQRKRSRLIESAKTRLEGKLKRSAKDEEIAAELQISLEDYQGWQSEIHSLVVGSLDTVNSEDDGRDMAQFVPTEEGSLPSAIFEKAELRKLLNRAMDRMPEPERTVLSMYYQEEKTLREISAKMNLHESRISQLKSQGVSRLRTLMTQRWPNRGAMAAAGVA